VPGTLRADLCDELFVWRPVLMKKCSLEEIKNGTYTLVDLQKMNALLDMQNDIQDQAIEDAKRESTTKP